MPANSQNGFLHRTPRPLLVFYLLVIYVFLQFCWWSYLLFDLNAEILTIREALAKQSGELISSEPLSERIAKKRLMIFGEGLVFILLLALGMIQTRRSFNREARVSRQQKNFLLSVTHELKSPLAAVKLYLQTLSKRELNRDKQLDVLGKASAEAGRLENLVENMLLAARIDNHAFLPAFESIDVSAELNQIVNDFEQRALIQIERIVPSGIFLSVDRQSFHSIVMNLLENALKYSSEVPEICLQLQSHSTGVSLRISDQGIGIAESDKARIFDKFFRAGNEETRKTKGTGLGLYIVHYLVALHNGSIRVSDNQPKGTVFEINFKS
jgi:two-component system phosphate regulon sensor histidine kinase PhoR